MSAAVAQFALKETSSCAAGIQPAAMANRGVSSKGGMGLEGAYSRPMLVPCAPIPCALIVSTLYVPSVYLYSNQTVMPVPPLAEYHNITAGTQIPVPAYYFPQQPVKFDIIIYINHLIQWIAM